jgi:hypothetical protein
MDGLGGVAAGDPLDRLPDGLAFGIGRAERMPALSFQYPRWAAREAL